MSTQVADVVNRAAYHSVANAATTLTSNPAEMIAKVAAFEQDVFTKVAQENRYFWQSFAATSSNAALNRTFDTATIGNVERIVRVTLTATGVPIYSVDIEDTYAEIAPRYYILGTVITEVGSDWGASGTVGITIGYAAAPAALDPNGSATQTITLPDKYADLLSIKLAGYLAQKDMESRDPAEVQNLDALYQSRLAGVIQSLDHFGGITRRRYIDPVNYPVASD